MDITEDMIKKLIKNLNAAENSRPYRTVEETIAAIDSVCAPDFKVSHNNAHFHDREKEREIDTLSFLARTPTGSRLSFLRTKKRARN